jgi:hypothetical protein
LSQKSSEKYETEREGCRRVDRWWWWEGKLDGEKECEYRLTAIKHQQRRISAPGRVSRDTVTIFDLERERHSTGFPEAFRP